MMRVDGAFTGLSRPKIPVDRPATVPLSALECSVLLSVRLRLLLVVLLWPSGRPSVTPKAKRVLNVPN